MNIKQTNFKRILSVAIAKRFKNTEVITDAYVGEFGDVVWIRSDGTELVAGFIEEYNLETVE